MSLTQAPSTLRKVLLALSDDWFLLSRMSALCRVPADYQEEATLVRRGPYSKATETTMRSLEPVVSVALTPRLSPPSKATLSVSAGGTLPTISKVQLWG